MQWQGQGKDGRGTTNLLPQFLVTYVLWRMEAKVAPTAVIRLIAAQIPKQVDLSDFYIRLVLLKLSYQVY